MSAIPASSVSLKTMADGTLRMTFDIEPAHAKDAFSLFSAPGTPVAIAALQVGYAAKSPEPEQKDPVGPLCKWLAIRCGEGEFWNWLEEEVTDGYAVASHEQAAVIVRQLLTIESRKEIDTNPEVAENFHKWVRIPYQRWLVRRQR